MYRSLIRKGLFFCAFLLGGGTLSAQYIITTAAGSGVQGYCCDGRLAYIAYLYFPADLALDRAGNLYIADQGNHRIRKVSPAGIITTVAGNGQPGFSGDGG